MLTFRSVHDQELVGIASTKTKVVSNFHFTHVGSLNSGSFWFGGSWQKHKSRHKSLHNCHYPVDMTVRMRTLLAIE